MEKIHHILSLSGGKDSTALALHIKENYPNIHEKIEYVFYDTGCDLEETYTYLNKIKVFIGKPITYVKPERSFEDIFYQTKILPNLFNRWCTVELKVKPSIKFLKNKIITDGFEKIKLYVGIRADESYRKGVVLKSKFEQQYIEPVYPLIEDGIRKEDVNNILISSGINYPDYYKWRSRNGCPFCPFQSLFDWVMLYEHHPDLFYKAVEYESKSNVGHTVNFRFNPKMPLLDIIKPDNIERIKQDHDAKQRKKNNKKTSRLKLIDVY